MLFKILKKGAVRDTASFDRQFSQSLAYDAMPKSAKNNQGAQQEESLDYANYLDYCVSHPGIYRGWWKIS